MEHRKIEGDCWIWTKRKDRYGYGIITLDYEKIKVHRLSYEIYVGPVGDQHILHKNICTSKACFNPQHLYRGTHSDNMKDAVQKGSHNWVRSTS